MTARWAGQGRKTRALRVSHAFHSPLMDPMLEEFAAAIGQVPFTRPGDPVISTLTGQAAGPEITAPAYWVRQVREPVLFHAAVTAVTGAGSPAVFVELGPDPVLAAAAQHAHPGAVAVSTLNRTAPDTRALARALAAIHTAGDTADWTPWFPPPPAPAPSTCPPTPSSTSATGWAIGRNHSLGPVVERADGGYLLSGETSGPWRLAGRPRYRRGRAAARNRVARLGAAGGRQGRLLRGGGAGLGGARRAALVGRASCPGRGQPGRRLRPA